jgi:regulator of replication initiation timing
MHEKIEKLSSLIDKLIEQNFKLKTETKSLKNRVEQQERKIDSLEK